MRWNNFIISYDDNEMKVQSQQENFRVFLYYMNIQVVTSKLG